jgi:lysophospholipase L1-like esterase
MVNTVETRNKGIGFKWAMVVWLFIISVESFAVQTDVVVFGDSWVNERDRLTKHLVAHFSQTSGLSGAGFCTLVESNGSASHGMAYLLAYSDWDITDQSAGAIGLNVSHVTGTTEDGILNFWLKSNVDEIEVYYLKQPGGGTFSCYGQDALLATVDTNSAVLSAGIHVVQWSPTVLPKFFRIRVSDPNLNGVAIGGVNLKTHTDGIRIHKIGNGGLTAHQAVAVDEDIWVDSLRALGPEIFCILMGTNDYARNVSPVVFKADIAELVTRVRLATPDVAIMLMSPGDNGLTGRTFALSDYRDVLIELCIEQDLKFIDLKKVLGDYASANGLGLYQDEIHPNNAGGALIADAWMSLVVEQEDHAPDLIDVLSPEALTSHSDFKILDVADEAVRLQWRRLPGLEYTFCKSLDLNEWDEELLPADYPQRVFIKALTEEENHFFKLKASYPEVW